MKSINPENGCQHCPECKCAFLFYYTVHKGGNRLYNCKKCEERFVAVRLPSGPTNLGYYGYGNPRMEDFQWYLLGEGENIDIKSFDKMLKALL